MLAVLIGAAVGVGGYLLAPVPVGANAGRYASGPGGTPPPSPSAGSPAPPTARTTSSPTAESPPFTRAALLLPEEFRGFGWGRADQTAIADGTEAGLPTLCVSPKLIAANAVESYSAEYQGAQTHAVEIVVRLADPDAAKSSADRLGSRIEDCAAAGKNRRGTISTRHDPKLPGVQKAGWWQLAVPAGAAGLDQPGRAAIAVARMDDRLVYLVLTSPTADPALTVQFEPLVTQAALRLV